MSIGSRRDDHPGVTLLFPPLVSTSFGNYYPSTALLAAYLEEHGIPTLQYDLNGDFLEFLMRPEHLMAVGAGRSPVGSVLPHEIEASAARLLQRNRDLIVDAKGRHMPESSMDRPGHLLDLLAELYRVDVSVWDILADGFFDRPVSRFYERFFASLDCLTQLPCSVHTVGISVPMGPQLAPAIILARHLSDVRPDLHIVLGGPTLSLMPQPELNHILRKVRAVKGVIRFDGEIALLKVVREIRNGGPSATRIPGLSCLEAGDVIHNAPAPGLNLGSAPYPLYSENVLARLANPMLGIVQARGCYWGKCAYCDYVELYEGSPQYRGRTPRSFVDEMEYQLRRHGIRRFCIVTEAIPPAFAWQMSRIVLERGMDVRWNSFAMVDAGFTQERLQIMRQAGCEYLVVGVETMTDRVLQLVQKAATCSENARFLENARAAGIRIKINLIPDLPTTTFDEAMAALDVVREYADCYDSVSIFPFEATRSSKIGQAPSRYGLNVLQNASLNGQAQYASNHLPVVDPAMSKDQRRKVYEAYRAFEAEVSRRRTASVVASAIVGKPLVAAERHWDVIANPDDQGGLLCYNWVTQRRFRFGRSWLPILGHIGSRLAFNKRLLESQLPPAEAEALYRQLLEFQLIVPSN